MADGLERALSYKIDLLLQSVLRNWTFSNTHNLGACLFEARLHGFPFGPTPLERIIYHLVIISLCRSINSIKLLKLGAQRGILLDHIAVCMGRIAERSAIWPLTKYLDQALWLVNRVPLTIPSLPIILPTNMSLWWSCTGMHFRLLELPYETRRLIYLSSIGHIIQPFTPRTHKRFDTKININLFLVNRQVYREALEAVYWKSTFYFDDANQIQNFFGCIAQPQESQALSAMRSTLPLPNPTLNMYLNIKRLELSFTHQDYMQFFGWELRDDDNMFQRFATNVPHLASSLQRHVETSRVRRGQYGRLDAWKLRDMNLDSLVLWMPHPDQMFDEKHGTKLEFGCQTDVIKIILGRSWPFVRGQPVTVTGYVRESVKAEFEALTNAALQTRRDWEKRDQAGELPNHAKSDSWDDLLDKGKNIDGKELLTTEELDTARRTSSRNANARRRQETLVDDDLASSDEFLVIGTFIMDRNHSKPPRFSLIPGFLPHLGSRRCHCSNDCGRVEWDLIDSDKATGVKPAVNAPVRAATDDG